MTIQEIRAKNALNNDTTANLWIRRAMFLIAGIGAWLASYHHAAGYVLLGTFVLFFLINLYLKIIKV